MKKFLGKLKLRLFPSVFRLSLQDRMQCWRKISSYRACCLITFDYPKEQKTQKKKKTKNLFTFQFD